ELHQRGGGIVDLDAVALSLFVDALRRRGPCRGRDACDAADDGFDHVAPVRIHIEHQAAAAGTIVPARPLARLAGTVEHPPAEFEPEADGAAEYAALHQASEFLQA